MVLVVLAAGFLGLCSILFPSRADTAELLKDARSGDVSVVQVASFDVDEVQVYWSTGYLQDYEFTYHYNNSTFLPEVEQFAADMRNRLGKDADTVTFEEGDRFDNLGILDMFIPVMYLRVMPHFAWLVVFCCAIALVDMVLRKKLRSPSAGYWLIASLVFAFGFPAYYWSEPYPLWSRRSATEGSRSAMSGLRVVGATACWAALGATALMTMALLRA
ncbi:hypothetical protein ABZ484_38660 [Streptomyces sp. NPDC006393]|uniref:hypothetical protein n=1 Tax=Streptomyces sp. NPDC006393 TaxID=3156763 RepID=UPI0033C60CB7